MVAAPGGRVVLPEPEVMPVPIVTAPGARLMSVQEKPGPILVKLALSVRAALAMRMRLLCCVASSTVLLVSSTIPC